MSRSAPKPAELGDRPDDAAGHDDRDRAHRHVRVAARRRDRRVVAALAEQQDQQQQSARPAGAGEHVDPLDRLGRARAWRSPPRGRRGRGAPSAIAAAMPAAHGAHANGPRREPAAQTAAIAVATTSQMVVPRRRRSQVGIRAAHRSRAAATRGTRSPRGRRRCPRRRRAAAAPPARRETARSRRRRSRRAASARRTARPSTRPRAASAPMRSRRGRGRRTGRRPDPERERARGRRARRRPTRRASVTVYVPFGSGSGDRHDERRPARRPVASRSAPGSHRWSAARPPTATGRAPPSTSGAVRSAAVASVEPAGRVRRQQVGVRLRGRRADETIAGDDEHADHEPRDAPHAGVLLEGDLAP